MICKWCLNIIWCLNPTLSKRSLTCCIIPVSYLFISNYWLLSLNRCSAWRLIIICKRTLFTYILNSSLCISDIRFLNICNIRIWLLCICNIRRLLSNILTIICKGWLVVVCKRWLTLSCICKWVLSISNIRLLLINRVSICKRTLSNKRKRLLSLSVYSKLCSSLSCFKCLIGNLSLIGLLNLGTLIYVYFISLIILLTKGDLRLSSRHQLVQKILFHNLIRHRHHRFSLRLKYSH